VKTARWRCKLR